MPYDPDGDILYNTGEFLKDFTIFTGKVLWYTAKGTYITSKFLAKKGYKLSKKLSGKLNEKHRTAYIRSQFPEASKEDLSNSKDISSNIDNKLINILRNESNSGQSNDNVRIVSRIRNSRNNNNNNNNHGRNNPCRENININDIIPSSIGNNSQSTYEPEPYIPEEVDMSTINHDPFNNFNDSFLDMLQDNLQNESVGMNGMVQEDAISRLARKIVESDKSKNKKLVTLLKGRDKSKLKMPNLSLDENPFLNYFSQEGKDIAFINGGIYSIEENNSGEKGDIIIFNKEYSLIKIEDICNLEKKFLEQNSNNIDTFRKSTLDTLSNEHKKLNKSIKRLRKNKKRNIEDFIFNYLIPIKKKESIIEESDLYEGNPPDIIRLDSIINEEFDEGQSFLEKTLSSIDKEYEGFILSPKKIFGIPKIKKVSKLLDKNKKYRVNNSNYIDSIDKFQSKYHSFIEKSIENKMQKSALSFIEKLYNEQAVLENCDKRLPGNKEGMYFDKKSENELVIYKKLDKFILNSNPNYFLFPSTRIGLRLTSNNDKIHLNEKPFVYKDPNYKHPFVPSVGGNEKKICLGDGNSNQYRRNKWHIRQDSNEDVAKSILEIFDRTEKMFYSIKDENPNNVYCSVDESSAEKIPSYRVDSLKRRGVPVFNG